MVPKSRHHTERFTLAVVTAVALVITRLGISTRAMYATLEHDPVKKLETQHDGTGPSNASLSSVDTPQSVNDTQEIEPSSNEPRLVLNVDIAPVGGSARTAKADRRQFRIHRDEFPATPTGHTSNSPIFTGLLPIIVSAVALYTNRSRLFGRKEQG